MPGDGNTATLHQVAVALGVVIHEGPAVPLADVHHDSREVEPGTLFVAVVGTTVDGHEYAADAVARGAVALLVEHPLPLEVPQLVVPDTRAALPVAASVVHGDPSEKLRIVGITGTNGKTTVAHMIEAIGHSAGLTTGLIGTLGAHIGSREVALERTTPESSDLQRLLAAMVDDMVELVAMEVSSHALALHRAEAVRFGVVAFTNLTRDHLDFHGSMEAYFTDKARLFTTERADRAVIWVGDRWGKRLAETTPLPVTRVGLGEDADVAALDLRTDAGGSSFTLRAWSEEAAVRLPLPAAFNVANALTAAASCLEAGLEFDDVRRAVGSLPQVPGRFEVVAGPWDFQVIVDYAHTPEAVAAVVAEAHRLASGRVLAVVGAGGDRDPDKRPLMGAAAGTADVTFVTSDNPRSEDPETIVTQVAAGVSGRGKLVVDPDRRAAIRAALGAAQPGDIVLVLGKGHEQGQEFAGGKVEPFDDRVVVREEGAAVMGGAAR